jgi:hypothetical protein
MSDKLIDVFHKAMGPKFVQGHTVLMLIGKDITLKDYLAETEEWRADFVVVVGKRGATGELRRPGNCHGSAVSLYDGFEERGDKLTNFFCDFLFFRVWL